MLRRTSFALNYRASMELDRIRSMLRGRARLERKVGLKRLFFLMRTQTRYRVEQRSYWNRAIVRKNVDSAAREHGSGWPQVRNDLARQNVILLPRSQQILAQYEPLAFRAVMELCGSRIAPPRPPLHAAVPAEAYAARPASPAEAHPAARAELSRAVDRMLRGSGGDAMRRSGAAEAWMGAWKEFDTAVGGRGIL